MHAPGHLRDRVHELLEEDWQDEENEVTRAALWEALAVLWNSTDIVPREYRDIVADYLAPYDEEAARKIRNGCTYGMMARALRPWLVDDDGDTKPRHTVTVRLPRSLFEELRRIAYLENRSLNHLLTMAAAEFVARWSADESEAEDAKDLDGGNGVSQLGTVGG